MYTISIIDRKDVKEMELVYFKSFIQVVKSGSYTKASYVLDYAQSSITTHIQKLEAIYGGTQLLERHGKTMKLTPAGETLYSYAEKMLALYEESHLSLNNQEINTVKIGSIESLAIFILPNIIAEFKKKYPDVKVQIFPYTEATILEKIHRNELDFGLIMDKPIHSERIQSLLLKKQEMKIVVYPEHPFTKKKSVTIEDLEKETIVLTEEGCTYRAYLLKQLEKNFIDYRLSMELSSIETIKRAVHNKWGIAFLPTFSIEGDSSVVGISYKDDDFLFYSQLINRRGRIQSQKLQYLIDLFAKREIYGYIR
ncbi:LysR family transcriptional regulator [Bacillus sp. B1-b2]|uniref:LysR family transcriptional regulator n=1 Tax=Bacillus sp. B1-b2 TaxID=2653201 RepID=UPI0012626196|nr:LysR family transcriptional regulator [Bacillus sp. B1-b2]KAB7671290.1 LysR family transcriptional regulator [Bacillus sp. B1-b2]